MAAMTTMASLLTSCLLLGGISAVAARVAFLGGEHSSEPSLPRALPSHLLALGASAAAVALLFSLLLGEESGSEELKLPAADSKTSLTYREERGESSLVPLHPKTPSHLMGAPLPKFTMAQARREPSPRAIPCLLSPRPRPPASLPICIGQRALHA